LKDPFPQTVESLPVYRDQAVAIGREIPINVAGNGKGMHILRPFHIPPTKRRLAPVSQGEYPDLFWRWRTMPIHLSSGTTLQKG